MDVIIKYVAALGIPKLVFMLATATSRHGGSAAMTYRLKQFSLNIGMEEGIGVFVLMGLVSYKLTEYYIEKHFTAKIEHDRLEKKLRITIDILNQIDTYPISKSLRRKLKAIYVLPNYY